MLLLRMRWVRPSWCQRRRIIEEAERWGTKRCYSTRDVGADLGVEKVEVVCGSSGSITVDFYNAKVLTNPNAPLILYLPPTGHPDHISRLPIPNYLLHLSTALARINYRWNKPPLQPTIPSATPSPQPLSSHPSFASYPFPTPLHDIHHAYAHIVDSVLPNYYRPPSTSPPPTPRTTSYSRQPAFNRLNVIQRPILIYGSFLGGSLATSIALTESRTSRTVPVKIAGLIVKNGVFDFSSLALREAYPLPTTPSPSSGLSSDYLDNAVQLHSITGSESEDATSPANPGHWTSDTLQSLKHTLFTTPELTFDSFASPIFFFRTSGHHIPKTWPSEENLPPSPPTEQEPIWADGFIGYDENGDPITASPSKNGNGNGAGKTVTTLDLGPPPAKSNLKFPPQATDLIIPPTLLLYTSSPSASPSSPTKTTSKRSSASKQASKSASSSTKKKKPETLKQILAQLGVNTTSPEAQAIEIQHLMTRSIMIHEMGYKVGGAYEAVHGVGDARGIAERRVQLRKVDSGVIGADGEEESEDEVVRDWIGDLIGTVRGSGGVL